MAVFLHAVSVDPRLRSIQNKAVECAVAIDSLKDSLKDNALQIVKGIIQASEKKHRPEGMSLPKLGPKAPVAYVIIDKSRGTASTVLAQHMTSVQQPPAKVDKGTDTCEDNVGITVQEEEEEIITEIPVAAEEVQEEQQPTPAEQAQSNVQNTTIDYENATFLNDFGTEEETIEQVEEQGETVQENPSNISLIDAIINADDQVIIEEKPIYKSESSKAFECSLCHKVFHSMYNMKAHMRIHTGEKPYCCPHCQKKFSDQSNYKTHLRRHAGKKPYRCDVCDKGFERLYDVRRHKDSIHNAEKGTMTCTECGKMFKRPGSYRKHIAICGVEIFQSLDKNIIKKEASEDDVDIDDENISPVIKSETDSPSQTDSPMVIRQIRYQCDRCEKGFSSLYNLKTHLRLHTGEKPYRCQFCERTFSDHSNFKLHIRRHKGERPYKCTTCGATFERLYTLRRHSETHQKNTKYKCGHCGKIFEKYSDLGKHITVHREEIVEVDVDGKPKHVQLKFDAVEGDVNMVESPVKKRKVRASRLKIVTPEEIEAAKIKTENVRDGSKKEQLQNKDVEQTVNTIVQVQDVSVNDNGETNSIVVSEAQTTNQSVVLSSETVHVLSKPSIIPNTQELVTVITQDNNMPQEQNIDNTSVDQGQTVEEVQDMSSIVQQLSNGTIVLQDTNENAAAIALAEFSSLGQNLTYSTEEVVQGDPGAQTIYILADDTVNMEQLGDNPNVEVAYVIDQNTQEVISAETIDN